MNEQVKIEWAKVGVKQLEIDVRGCGYEAIQAKAKLEYIKSLNEDEFKEAAIFAYDAHH